MAILRSRACPVPATIVSLFLIWLFYSAGSASPDVLLQHAAKTLLRDRVEDVRNATLGFEKIFVINLASRTDHRDDMTLAASATGLQFEFITAADDVLPKTLPPGNASTRLNRGEMGNWRSHMNVAQKIVNEGISSALIMEDDVDWDLRIKDQMKDFAEASQMLLQPIRGKKDVFLDPTYPRPSSVFDKATTFFLGQDEITRSKVSPYGDLERWDLLWIGHCGTYFPGAVNENRALGRVAILDDLTVPEPQHVGFWFGNDTLLQEYPAHTRVVSRASRNICTFAYALSFAGARRLLFELGTHYLDEPTDIEMRSFCDGDGRPVASCLTVQPELFQHHRPRGNKAKYSDIGFHGDDENKVAFTRNIRWSTRLNLDKLMSGRTDYIDQYRDGEESVDYGWG